MSPAESRALRLIRLITLLDAHRHGISIQELAARLGITQRQVYRDLASVAALGYPLTCPERGRYALLDGYRVPRVFAA